MEHVVTSVGWSPNGEVFAVGSHDVIRLCDKTGWTHCRERIQTGSILSISWTPDGTQFAGAGGNGAIVFAQVVDRKLEWKNTEVTLVGPRKLRVQDLSNEGVQDIDIARDRVVEIGLGFDHLIVTTTTQCSIYSLQNLNTPTIFEIKAPPHFIQLCARFFLTLDQVSGLQVIDYADGRVRCSPRFQGLRAEYLTREMVALSPDVVAVVDTVDNKNVYLVDASSNNRTLGRLVHSGDVVEVSLNQFTIPQERLLAFADRNKDFYVAQVYVGSTAAASATSVLALPTYKLLAHVDSFVFNDETDVLVGLVDGRVHTWYQPSAAFVDRDLMPLTSTSTGGEDLGRSARITAYTGGRVAVRKSDGAMTFFATNADIDLLYRLVREGLWQEALRLCRYQRTPSLWASFAILSLAKRKLDEVEICLGEVNEVAKVRPSDAWEYGLGVRKLIV